MESVWNFVIIFAQVSAVVFGVFIVTAIVAAVVSAVRRHGDRAAS
ncbi:MAG: hypothetical protein ACTMHH_00740 [Nesterenkonia sp.]